MYFLVIHDGCSQVEETTAPVSKIRVVLSSTKVGALEKVCSDLKSKILGSSLKVRGPVRLPTKVLKMMVRKSPCGEGTNTYDRFQMRVHKRLIDFEATADDVKKVTNVFIEPGVDVEIIMSS